MDECSTRLAWPDNVKAFAILMVMLGHVTGLFSGATAGISHLGSFIVLFNMPLFVLISGYMGGHSFERIHDCTSLEDFFERLIRRIVIPSVICSAVYPIIKGDLLARKLWLVYFIAIAAFYSLRRFENHFAKNPKTICKFVLFPFLIFASFKINYFWFLAMIIEFQAIYAIAHYLCLKINVNKWILSLVVCILVITLNDGWKSEMVTYFVIGVLASSYRVVDKLSHLPWWCMIVATAAIIPCCVICSSVSFYEYSIYDLIPAANWYIFPLRQLCGFVLSAILIWIIKIATASYSWWSKFGACSMALYMIHTQILAIFPIHIESVSPLLIWMQMIGLTICMATATYIIIQLLSLNRVTRILFLGKD